MNIEENKNILSGIDIVKNERIKRLVERSPHAVNNIFSKNEIEHCMKKKFYEQSLGARFAVKEAILKATDSHIFEFKLSDIEIINSKTGKPKININSSVLDLKIKKILNKDEYIINVSMSHEKEFSIAQVIIY